LPPDDLTGKKIIQGLPAPCRQMKNTAEFAVNSSEKILNAKKYSTTKHENRIHPNSVL